MKEVVEKLIKQNKTISIMESCTGGGVSNAITDIEGSSEVLKFSAVTYSNEFKIKMGVSKEIIDKYSVYSAETAKQMSKKISFFTNSNYGIGITGKLNKSDKNNPHGEDNVVFVSIYDKECNRYIIETIETLKLARAENKKLIIKAVIKMLLKII